ncbi:hypothetical protein [Paragemmobacter straminiformis]|uniref:Plasmid recombination enzyme n=1 Tax=Paragemmobacter straminiformis TaxID=2045119 RepID=A0A842I9K2_9RHOB|nr:hypothetical protein [Gemmobacter straminiformis]MBC2836520.1 hypothetical protein [Gemmobacter straminiformis]
MSLENYESFARKREIIRHRIVLRFAELFPSGLAGVEMHANRKGGNLEHVDQQRTRENEILIGDADWRAKLEAEIEAARLENLAEELEALKRRKRQSEWDARRLEGKADPWKASKKGPLREVILTAGKDWFAERDQLAEILDESRQQWFETMAVEWLKANFGDAVVHARADHDEMTFHIHAVIAPWSEKTTARRGKQRVLQPSAYPMLASYEAAQDSVGIAFATIGLERGRRTAALRRAATKTRKDREEQREALTTAGQAVPEYLEEAKDPLIPRKRQHVPTPVWWAEETQRLNKKERELKAAAVADAERKAKLEAERADIEQRKENLTEREKDADELLLVIDGIAENAGRVEAREYRPRTQRFLDTLRKARDAFRSKIELDAEKKLAQGREAIEKERKAVETERKALDAERTAVERFKSRVLGFAKNAIATLPTEVKQRFVDALRPEAEKVKEAEKSLQELRKRDPNGSAER